MLHDNIPRIIRWYKGRTAFEAHKLNPLFEWQPRYHDHIIKDRAAFSRIALYIFNNPKQWTEDKFYQNV